MLAGYSPAEQVGTRVRSKIRALLLNDPEFHKLLGRRQPLGADLPSSYHERRQSALDALARLQASLDDVERQIFGIGHNNPPEPLSLRIVEREAFNEVRQHVASLEVELEKPSPDVASVATGSEALIRFGVKLGTWVGQRTTKFVDVALASLAPAIILKVTGLLPLLLDALGAVARAVAH